MAKKRQKIKSSSSIKKLESGRMLDKPLFVITGILLFLLLGVGLFIFQPWNHLGNAVKNEAAVVTKPKLDMARARQMTIDPRKDSVMQIITREKVRVTLEVPMGAIKEKMVIKLIPFYYDEKSQAPTAGVVVGPASVNFSVPVTLSFNFSESKFKNLAPKTVVEQKIRTTGLSQVMQIDANANSLTPTLIARGLETETYLPARILTGGAYVFSLDGKSQVTIAKKALSTEGMHTLTIMESATVLLFNNEKLSDTQLKKTKAAVAKILSKKTPPAFEFYAALVLQKKINKPSFSLIPQVYAYSTDEGFFQVVCKEDTHTVAEYIGFAKSAQLMGHDSIADSCLNKAKNKVAEDAKKVIAGNPDLKTIMVALQNVQLLGLDSETNLEGQLTEKAKEVATEGAKKVADDPNSSALDAAIEMQKMEGVGADQGPTYDKLKQKVTDLVDKKEAAADKASDDYQKGEADREAEMERLSKEAEKEEERLSNEYTNDAIQQEDILQSQVMSQLGIGLLQAFGFDELDKESLKKKFDKMQEDTKMLVDAGYTFCTEMRAEGIDAGNCEEQNQKASDMLKEAEDMSYRVENEVGSTQSREYEQPEYLDENGDYSLYFEEEVTPTPEESNGDTQIQDETNNSQDENTMDSSSDSSDTSSSEPDVQQSDE